MSKENDGYDHIWIFCKQKALANGFPDAAVAEYLDGKSAKAYGKDGITIMQYAPVRFCMLHSNWCVFREI